MKINIETKYKVGQRVYVIEHQGKGYFIVEKAYVKGITVLVGETETIVFCNIELTGGVHTTISSISEDKLFSTQEEAQAIADKLKADMLGNVYLGP